MSIYEREARLGHHQRSRGAHLFPANYAIDVVVARLDVEADAIDASAALLSDVELQRASRFAFERDRNRFIVARARLRELLAERLGVAT